MNYDLMTLTVWLYYSQQAEVHILLKSFKKRFIFLAMLETDVAPPQVKYNSLPLRENFGILMTILTTYTPYQV